MSIEMVDMYIMTHQEYFPSEKIPMLKEKLENISEDRFKALSMVELKKPSTLLIISIFLGAWGVDRFMLGEAGMGVLKLLTGGCCGVLTIIDWFNIMKKTKEKNFEKVWNATL